jgi:hypothetical protein
VLAFWYDVEFAQAVFCLMAPMTLVVWISVRKVQPQDHRRAAQGRGLFRTLTIHRRVCRWSACWRSPSRHVWNLAEPQRFDPELTGDRT